MSFELHNYRFDELIANSLTSSCCAAATARISPWIQYSPQQYALKYTTENVMRTDSLYHEYILLSVNVFSISRDTNLSVSFSITSVFGHLNQEIKLSV